MSLINNDPPAGGALAPNQRNSLSIPTNKNSGIFQTHNNNSISANSRGINGGQVANSRTLDNSNNIFGQHHHTAGITPTVSVSSINI
jgi:hypothetical protein